MVRLFKITDNIDTCFAQQRLTAKNQQKCHKLFNTFALLQSVQWTSLNCWIQIFKFEITISRSCQLLANFTNAFHAISIMHQWYYRFIILIDVFEMIPSFETGLSRMIFIWEISILIDYLNNYSKHIFIYLNILMWYL